MEKGYKNKDFQSLFLFLIFFLIFALGVTVGKLVTERKAASYKKEKEKHSISSIPKEMEPNVIQGKGSDTTKKSDVVKKKPSKPEKAVSSVPITRPGTVYTVRVGSFKKVGNAHRLSKSLKNRGYASSVTEAVVKGKKWYRVSVGEFNDRKKPVNMRLK